MVSFNGSGIKTINDKVPAGKLKELNDKLNHPDCSTPLYDAIGGSVTSLRNFLSKQTEYTVLVTIITDGVENDSVEYKGEHKRKMIDELKLTGWIFTYIGANHDVERFAVSISIDSFMEFVSDSEGTQDMNVKSSKARKSAYDKLSAGLSSYFLNVNFFKDDMD